MKRLLFFLTFTMAAVCVMQAGPVNAQDARQVANQFLSAQSPRFTASAGQAATRLAYTADAGRFYVFDRSVGGGFVVVAGDDRLPQVLGYSETGTFAADNIPLAMQDWMAEMNREIAYLQSHSGAKAHKPVPRTPVEPLMTTRWDQGWPYNLLCPTYGSNATQAVTGCVATAMVQIMNYHQWPLQGTGSHTYTCNVNDTDPTTLSADFSQSVYEWNLMLDTYDQNSSEESCYAVAKLMSDAGISINMGYGSSSGASEMEVLTALTRYFGYSNRHYLLNRDLYGADEWDQLLTDEISAGRPVLYCGYTYTQGSLGGHAFVFDGIDANGLFHVNWGWGGSSDGYFMVSLLAPGQGMNFQYGQDCIFGIVPAYAASDVSDVLYVRGIMHPDMSSVPRGDEVSMKFADIYVEGNLMDTVGIEGMGYWTSVYDTIPMELRVIDQDGVVQQTRRFSYKVYISGWGNMASNIGFTPDASLADGDYTLKIAYSPFKDGNYDSWVCDDYGKEVYCKMLLSDDMVYLSDCSLAATYNLESMEIEQSILVDEPFDVDVTLTYPRGWGPPPGGGGGQPGGQPEPSTTGEIHLLLQKDGVPVATSEPMAISIPRDSTMTFTLQMMAPSQWGRYQLMVVDDRGRLFEPESGWMGSEEGSGIMNIVVAPISDYLIEDFESMPVSTRTNDTHVQGQFTSWNFNKSGVRAPGEGKCYGERSVMMKKPSTFYSIEPVSHHFFMAEATIFNPSSTEAKFTLEYSVDNAATWIKAVSIDGDAATAAVVPAASTYHAIWQFNVQASQPVLFRIAMTGGGSAAAYVDNFVLRYNDVAIAGDVNVDGEVNIGDLNTVVDVILGGTAVGNADLNGDGEINIADINALIDLILK